MMTDNEVRKLADSMDVIMEDKTIKQYETYQGQERGSFPELKPVDYDDPSLGKDNVLTVELLDRAYRELTSLSVEQGATLDQLDAAFDIVKR